MKRKNNRKNNRKKMKKYQWVIILLITVFATMYIYGMATIYFPEPIHLGAGQYIDIATGIVIVGILFSGVLIAILFKRRKTNII